MFERPVDLHRRPDAGSPHPVENGVRRQRPDTPAQRLQHRAVVGRLHRSSVRPPPLCCNIPLLFSLPLVGRDQGWGSHCGRHQTPTPSPSPQGGEEEGDDMTSRARPERDRCFFPPPCGERSRVAVAAAVQSGDMGGLLRERELHLVAIDFAGPEPRRRQLRMVRGVRIGRARSRSLRGPLLAGSASPCAHDDDRLRLPPASPAQNSSAEKTRSNGLPPHPTLPAVRQAILELIARPPPQRCPPDCRKWMCSEKAG